MGYFWGGDICRVNAACEEQSLTSSCCTPVLQDGAPSQPQAKPSAAAAAAHPQTPFTTHWHSMTCCSTDWFITVFFSQEPFFFFCNTAEQIYRELSSNKKTCCCCIWGCMKYHWCTFVFLREAEVAYKIHSFSIFLWGRSELCTCTAPNTSRARLAVETCDVSSGTLSTTVLISSSCKEGSFLVFF